MDRRTFLQTTAMAGVALAAGSPAMAEWNPRRPLNIIVPYKAGGGTDAYARAIAAAAANRLPVPVVVVNKPGASGMTGAIAAGSARPDGNTILMHSTGSFLLGHMLKDSELGPFDGFKMIAQIGNLKACLAVPAGSPIQSVQDLVDAAKAAPGSLRWAHTGKGSTYHVSGQTFLNTIGLDAVDVPFKGGSAVRAAVLGEQVDFAFIGVQQGRGFEEQMHRLAVLADARDELAPDVPTFAELGFDVPVVSSPIILFAPEGVDPEIIAGIEGAMADIVAAPEFGELVNAKGTLPLYRTGAEAETALRAMQEAVTPVIEALKGNLG
ncbi:MAG: tripartite tricarboxylate transporter substrate binding protein [Paracoccaceae bacterium]|uniref:Bug family tripartite tricarboxylate transporter substrate binding protein n=1 Tax=Alphaproteobacteria TaxID=28211 RepID=UPI0032651047